MIRIFSWLKNYYEEPKKCVSFDNHQFAKVIYPKYYKNLLYLKPNYLKSKVLRHHFYLCKVIIQVQTGLEYSAG